MTTLLWRYLIPLSTALLCLIPAIFSSELSAILSYQRSHITEGELWRLVSANALHTNWNHWALNMGGLFLIWFIFWDVCNKKWQAAFLIGPTMLNTLLLYFLSPQLQGYVGLSGALHGTIVAFGLADWPKNKWTSTALIIGVTAKLTYEQLYGSSESVKQLINANVAVDAHLWGAVSGVLVGTVYLIWRYRRPAIHLVEK